MVTDIDKVKERLFALVFRKRKRKHYTQAYVASQLGLNPQTYSRKEHYGNFSIEDLVTLQKILDISAEELADAFRKETD